MKKRIVFGITLAFVLSLGKPGVVLGDAGLLSEAPITAEDIYVGGRGLITTTGPSGLFINPTSGVLPEGAYTAQYCFFLPNSNWSTASHGGLLSYGLTDWLEAGAIVGYADSTDTWSYGPQVKVRLLADDPASWVPELSIYSYARFIDGGGALVGVGPALFKGFELDRDGFFRSCGVHVGARYENNDTLMNRNGFNGYLGGEIEMPLRIYLVGEVSTKEKDRGETKTPYAAGFQWRAGGINISIAGIQAGAQKGPRLYFGIGTALTF